MKSTQPEDGEQHAPQCERCGRPIEPTYLDTGLCGDCYWDQQTDEDGSLG